MLYSRKVTKINFQHLTSTKQQIHLYETTPCDPFHVLMFSPEKGHLDLDTDLGRNEKTSTKTEVTHYDTLIRLISHI